VLGIAYQTQHLWAMDRQQIERAITDGDYHKLGERRAGALY